MCCGIVDKLHDSRSQGTVFKSQSDNYALWQDVNLHFPLSTQVLNGYPIGCQSLCSLLSIVSVCKMAPDGNAPQ